MPIKLPIPKRIPSSQPGMADIPPEEDYAEEYSSGNRGDKCSSSGSSCCGIDVQMEECHV